MFPVRRMNWQFRYCPRAELFCTDAASSCAGAGIRLDVRQHTEVRHVWRWFVTRCRTGCVRRSWQRQVSTVSDSADDASEARTRDVAAWPREGVSAGLRTRCESSSTADVHIDGVVAESITFATSCKRVYHVRVSSSATRGHRNWQAGDVFTVDRRHRALRGRSLGKGLLLGFPDGPRPRPPDEGPGALHRPEAARRSPDAPRDPSPGADPVPRHPPAPRRRHPQRLQVGDHPAPVRGPLRLRLPDQGQPAAAGRRGSARFRPGVRVRPRGGLEAGAARRCGAGLQRHPDHL